MIKCVCIDDKNMPSDFRQKNLWIKESVEYHIERVLYITKSETLGVQLAEIDLYQNTPYTYFAIKRFAINDLPGFLKLLEACKEESDVKFDIDILVEKLINSEELEIVE